MSTLVATTTDPPRWLDVKYADDDSPAGAPTREVVAVIGALSGIVRAIAIGFAQHGFKVANSHLSGTSGSDEEQALKAMRLERPHYAPTKAGILSWMQSCAVALGKRSISCNAILPGKIRTEKKPIAIEERITLGTMGRHPNNA